MVIFRTTRDPSVGACCGDIGIFGRRLLLFYKEYNWLLAPELVPRRMAPVASSLAEGDDRI